MPSLTHLSFQVLPDGRVDCNYQYADGMLTTFDPDQLPEKVAPLLSDLVVAQQARLAEVEPKAALADQAVAAKEAAEAEVISIRDELIDVRGQLIAKLNPGPETADGEGGVVAAVEAPAQSTMVESQPPATAAPPVPDPPAPVPDAKPARSRKKPTP